MDYARRELLKTVATRVVEELWSDLKAGRIKAIGIDAIRAHLRLEPAWRNQLEFDELEKLTTRRLVEKVG